MSRLMASTMICFARAASPVINPEIPATFEILVVVYLLRRGLYGLGVILNVGIAATDARTRHCEDPFVEPGAVLHHVDLDRAQL